MIQKAKLSKVLFLGSAQSGKTVCCKQLSITHGAGITMAQNKILLKVIMKNMLSSIKALVEYVLEQNQDITQFEDDRSRAIITKISTMDAEDPPMDYPTQFMEELHHVLTTELCIREADQHRHKFDNPPTCEHGLEMIDQYNTVVTNPEAWFVKSTSRTVGVQESLFKYKGFDIKTIDVGGQRPERKKWNVVKPEANCIVFVVSLSEYTEKCIEDPDYERMWDTLDLFEATVNDADLATTPIVLLFNKADLFYKRIVQFDLTMTFEPKDVPQELQTKDREVRSTAEFATANINFIKQKFIDTIRDVQRKEFISSTLQVGSMIDPQEFATVVENVFVSARNWRKASVSPFQITEEVFDKPNKL
jgi:GTPase SAR1 family protein